MPLFDPRPKIKEEDFFDMREELDAFRRYVTSSPMTLVLGLRRYGKTSLILTGLNSIGAHYVYVDCRALPSGMFGVGDFALLLARSINDFMRRCGGLRSVLARLLRGVEGVTVDAFGVTINLRRFRPQSLFEVLDCLGGLGEDVVLVVDEAQELRRMVKYRADQLLAYVYDNLRNVRLVISGSQVGLLFRLLRLGDPGAPLYGRPRSEVTLRRLSEDLSREFLEAGFKEYGLSVSTALIDYVVERVDGIIGWLTYVGFKAVSSGSLSREVVDRVLREAASLATEELRHFLSLRPGAEGRYLAILEAVAALGKATWSEILRYVEARVGRVPKPTLASFLNNLVDAGFLQKIKGGYVIPDPVLREALKKGVAPR